MALKASTIILEVIHTITLFCIFMGKDTCIASFWPTVHTDPENAATENALFWKRVPGWKNPKTQPSHSHVDSESTYFPKRWHHCPTPWPLASDLWTLRHLITATKTMADYCLCLCFLQLTHLVVECESQQQFDLIIDPHKRFWFLCTSHFRLLLLVFRFSFYCLFVNSVQALWAHSVSSSPFLVNFKHHLTTRNVNYSVFSRFQWIRMDTNILGTMPRKMEEKKIVLVRVDKALNSWRRGVLWENLGRLKTRCTAVFWIRCNCLVAEAGSPVKSELQWSRWEMTSAWTRSCVLCEERLDAVDVIECKCAGSVHGSDVGAAG